MSLTILIDYLLCRRRVHIRWNFNRRRSASQRIACIPDTYSYTYAQKHIPAYGSGTHRSFCKYAHFL